MIKNRKGLTLVEVIMSIAILALIAIAFTPIISTEFLTINRGTEITQQAFLNQRQFEDVIFDAQTRLKSSESLASIDGWSEETVTVFDNAITLTRLKQESAHRNNKTSTIYLSKQLSELQNHKSLAVQNVYIDVDNDDSNSIADLTTSPKLTIRYDDNSSQPTFYTNLYRWYKTEPGVDLNNVSYPEDYTLIDVSTTTDVLENLLDHVGANSYVVATIIPVDIHGYRGSPVRSANIVYVKGEEWRVGAFPWVDKNHNYDYDNETIDIKLVSDSVQNILDTMVPFPNPSEPSTNLDLRDGSLFVPMRIDNSVSIEPGKDPIIIEGDESVNWKVERNINLAKDIKIINGSDAIIESAYSNLGGNINIHPYVEIGQDGNPVLVNNRVQLLKEGVTLETSGKIRLDTINRGNVNFYGHSNFFSNEIAISAKGSISIESSRFEANEILLDTTNSIGLPALRRINLNETEFYSETPSSIIRLRSPEVIEMKGGSWSSKQVLSVEDNGVIQFEKGSKKVNNLGLLDLKNTGRVRFKNSMIEDLSNQLRLRIVKDGQATLRIIPHNYHRNIDYANALNDISLTSPDEWQPLGSGQTNIEFSSVHLSGNGRLSDIQYSFDGNDKMTISVNTTRETSPTRVRLEFNDQYAFNSIRGLAFFTYSIDSNGNVSIDIEDEITVKSYVLTFNTDGGSTIDPMVKEVGSSITPPENPTKIGYSFLEWKPELPQYMENYDLTVNAIWMKNKYEVIYDSQDGKPEKTVKEVSYGDTYPKVLPPSKAGYQFMGWFTQRYEGSKIDGNTPYLLTENTTVYAQWKAETYTVTLDSNGGSAPSIPTKIVPYGGEYGELPSTERYGYKFMGWSTTKNPDDIIDPSDKVTSAGHHTLFAIWDSENESLKVINLNSKGGRSFTLTFNNPIESIVETSIPQKLEVNAFNETKVDFDYDSRFWLEVPDSGDYYLTVRDSDNNELRVNLRLQGFLFLKWVLR